MGKRAPDLFIALFIYAWSLAWIGSRHTEGVPPGNDSAYYLVTAQGFAEGRPFSDASSPHSREGAVQGPSFFPLVLSLYWKFLHPDFRILQILVALSIALGPVLAFFWLRLYLAASLALPCALAYGAAYMFIVQGNSVMTESVFIPMFYAALLLSAGERAGAAAPIWVVIARTRVIGWFFLGAYLFLQAKRRRWALIAATAAAAGAWSALERWMASGVPTSAYAEGVTKRFPLLSHPLEGLRGLAANLWTNVFDYATAIDAHILLPYLYNLAPMSRGKRLVCLAVFLWTVWGCWLAWRDRASLRPWIVGLALSSVPTFLVFESHDSFRYMLPFFPFLLLFFLAPFELLARKASAPWAKRLPLWACLAMLAGQAAHSSRHDFETEFIDSPRDFAALHDDMAALPDTFALVLSPDPYYSFLETGSPSMQFLGRHGPGTLKAAARDSVTWAVCGPRNDYFCERMEREGMVFGEPLAVRGNWRVRRVETWPAGP